MQEEHFALEILQYKRLPTPEPAFPPGKGFLSLDTEACS